MHKYQPVTVNRITFTMGIFIIAPLGAPQLIGTNFNAIPADIWVKIIYTLLITSYLVYLLNSYGIKHGSSALVGIYIYLQPILATAIAVLLGRDALSFEKLILTLVILFGVWLVMGSDKRTFGLKNIFGK
jgi:drug/metabolite transporter (DMT)-like permease